MTTCECLARRIGPCGVFYDDAGYAPMSGNFWDPNVQGLDVFAAYRPKLAVDQATSYTDLTGNGNDCTVGVAPGWGASVGWTFDGATQYLIIPNFPIQDDESQSMVIQYSNANIAANYKGLIGRSQAGCRFALYCRYNGDEVGYAHSSVNVRATAPALAAGNLAVAGKYGYRDGYFDCDLTADDIANQTQNLLIGRAGIHFASAYVQAVVLYNCALTWIQMRQIARAMAAIAAV